MLDKLVHLLWSGKTQDVPERRPTTPGAKTRRKKRKAKKLARRANR